MAAWAGGLVSGSCIDAAPNSRQWGLIPGLWGTVGVLDQPATSFTHGYTPATHQPHI